MRWAQRQRMLFIGHHLLEHGRINRADLIAKFGVSPAQAATDFRVFREVQPGVAAYDARVKAYVRAEEGKAP